MGDARDWAWTLRCLWAPGAPRLELDLPDSLLLRPGGAVDQWLFTAQRSGCLLKKADKSIRPEPLRKAMEAFAAAARARDDADPVQEPAAVIYWRGGGRRLVTLAQLQMAIATPGSLDLGEAAVLQKALRPGRACSCKYKLDANGLTFSAKAKGADGEELPPATQRAAAQVASLVAQRVHEVGKVKVARMKLHLALHGRRLWLTHVTGLHTVHTQQTQAQTQGEAATCPLSLSEPAAKRHRLKRCAGDFCGYRAASEQAWQQQQMDAGLDDGGSDQDAKDRERGPQRAAQHTMAPVSELRKLPYRSVALARERRALGHMDPLLQSWTKRQAALRSKLKQLSVHVEPAAMAGRHVRVLLQESYCEVEWFWRGDIGYVDLNLRPVGKLDPPIALARAVRNTGCIKVHVPLVHPTWAEDVRYWRLEITDSSDASIAAESRAFVLGGGAGQLPDPSRTPEPPAEPPQEDLGPVATFQEAHKLANYHRSVKVCANCAAVYRMLDSVRIDSDTEQLDRERELDPVAALEKVADNPSDGERGGERRQRKLFERLALPKARSSDDDTGFMDCQPWGAGFSLRSAKVATTNNNNNNHSNNHSNSSSSIPEEESETHQPGSRTSAPRRRKPKHRKNASGPLEELTATFTDHDTDADADADADDEGEDAKRRRARRERRKLDRHAQGHRAPLAGRQGRDPRGLISLEGPGSNGGGRKTRQLAEPLDPGKVEAGSPLHQILCLLALGDLSDCDMLVKLVDKRGLACLAFARLEGGRIVVRQENPNQQRQHGTPLRKPPTFGQTLSRTKRGRGILGLLAAHLAVAKAFSAAVTDREPPTAPQLAQAVAALERFEPHHKVSRSRLLLLQGLQQARGAQPEAALEAWRGAKAAATRFEGMWSYNVGVAHLLIGRADSEAAESHLAAAKAVFSRLGLPRELALVHQAQGATSDAQADAQHRAEQRARQAAERRAAVEPLEEVGQSATPDAQTSELLRKARLALDQTRRALDDKGLRLEQLDEQLEPDGLVRCAREVERVLEAAQADMDILEATPVSHKHFAHRKARISDALELVKLRMDQLLEADQSLATTPDKPQPDQFQHQHQQQLQATLHRQATLTDDDLYADEDEAKEYEGEGEGEGEGEDARGGALAACRLRHLPQLKASLAGGQIPLDAEGNSPLHLAAAVNWIQGIHTCLSAGVPIDSRNHAGVTPLQMASQAGHATAQTLLTALGACS